MQPRTQRGPPNCIKGTCNDADQVRTAVDSWNDEIRDTAAYELAARGQIPMQALAFYLESMRYLFYHSERSMGYAVSRCAELGDHGLEQYFKAKVHEENGHDRWPQNDLDHLPEGCVLGVEPAGAIRRLVELQARALAEHPICLLAYAVWAEYMTACLGAETVAMLVSGGYERGQLSTITNHVDADGEHAIRGFAELDSLWSGQVSAEAIFNVVKQACQLFSEFCVEIHDCARRVA